MTQRILVVNPNSNERVTGEIAAAVACLRIPNGPVIDCATLAEGPPGIETQVHVDTVVEPLLRLAQRESNATSALVIACFSDPGLYSLREALDMPVFGIAESGFSAGADQGRPLWNHLHPAPLHPAASPICRRPRPRRPTRRRPGHRDGGERPRPGRSRPGAPRRGGRQLKEEDGADVLLLGCAGMARYRKALQDRLGIPVVDPVQAAVGLAQLALQLESQA
jgi:Hydantoin racemase